MNRTEQDRYDQIRRTEAFLEHYRILEMRIKELEATIQQLQCSLLLNQVQLEQRLTSLERCR